MQIYNSKNHATREESLFARPRSRKKRRTKEIRLLCQAAPLILMLGFIKQAQAALSTCDPGYYLESGSCLVCPAGSSCAGGTSTYVACGSTEFSFKGSTSCTSCPAGYKCSGVSLSNPDGVPEMCPVGTYSPVGVTACLSCTAGTYCNTAASAAPVACPDGYISADGATLCDQCPPGYQCPSKTSASKSECPDGSYSLGGAASCTGCSAG